jgi:hypothetical protein
MLCETPTPTRAGVFVSKIFVYNQTMKNQETKVKDLIELLALHEEAVAFLYDRFSYQFPKTTLWVKLTKDERAHAKIIRGLAADLDFKTLSANPKVFQPSEIEKSIQRLEKLAASTKKYDLEQAFTLAYKLESNLVEHHFFKVFYSYSNEFEKVFTYLEKATAIHADKIRRELG